MGSKVHCAAGTNAHIIVEDGSAAGAMPELPDSRLLWQRSRHWVAPVPSAWLLRAASAGSPTRLECDLHCPRLACVRDWHVLGRPALPFGCCAAIAAAGAALLSEVPAAKAPARAALIGCVTPAPVLLLPKRSALSVSVATSGAVELHLLSAAARDERTVFSCDTARLRRCMAPSPAQRPQVLPGRTLALAGRYPQKQYAAKALAIITGSRQQDRSTWTAALLSAALMTHGLTGAQAACTQVAASACTVREQDEQDSTCSATATLHGGTCLVTAAASLECLAVSTGATLVPLPAEAVASNALQLAQPATLEAGLRYTMQWQADSTMTDDRHHSIGDAADSLTASLTAPQRSTGNAELASTARMLAILQTAAATGTGCLFADAAEPVLTAGSQIAAHDGAARSAACGLLRAAVAEVPGSVRISSAVSVLGAPGPRVHASVAVLPRDTLGSQVMSTHHPLGSLAQSAAVSYRPLLLPIKRSRFPTSQPATVPAVVGTAHVRPQGTTLIVGGLGGVGRQIAMWLLAYCPARLLLASRTGHSSPGTMLSLCTGAAMVTMVRCDIAAKGPANWLAGDAAGGPINVSGPDFFFLCHSVACCRLEWSTSLLVRTLSVCST